MAKRIYFLTSQSGMNGGIKVAYQHVAALRRHGFDASIVHNVAEPPTWFPAPDVPILAARHIHAGADDVLVIGEDVNGTLRSWAGHAARKVVLCQNHFYIPKGLGDASDYREFGVSAAVTTGEVIAAFMRHRFPGLPVATVHLSIDQERFRPLEKALQIAVMPRKRPIEHDFIRDLLRANPRWRQVRWAILQGAPEATVTEVLGRSAIFLSLARFEGVGMSALEAMSCGCAVAGFDGIGGREYAAPQNGFWAPEDELEAAAEQLDACIKAVVDGTAAARIAAGRMTAAAYTLARMEAELVAFWREFLA
ncbi:glycosyltransferase [Azospirillum sp. SYSU D00513]|uniref:glycosyltransferase n=1 Tax=Azospirillum sp. SYSU D00513 TaxID=2812561 RepID=UPI001A95AC2A|nr:glycosyltransferase [Azospirillum sp. SYSU D00513]